MRETLHQLTLALALPITVGAVWIARGDRIDPAVRERATAYRVELAQLPLPTRERLRSPGLPTATVSRSAPQEEAAPGERRPAQPETSETGTAPLDLRSRGDSAASVEAAPSPRPSLETPGAAPRNAPSVAAPVAMPVQPLSSRHTGNTVPGIAVTRSAETATAAPTATAGQTARATSTAKTSPAATVTPVATVTPAAKPSPSEKAPATDVEPNLFRRERLLALQDVPLLAAAFRDPRVVAQQETPQAAAPPSASPTRGLGLGGLLPIAHELVLSEPTPSPKMMDKDGREPLLPIRKLVDIAQDFSWSPGSEPSVLHDALPPLGNDGDEKEHGKSQLALEPSPFLNWSALKPTFLLTPEPGSATLLGAALAGLGALRRSRRRV